MTRNHKTLPRIICMDPDRSIHRDFARILQRQTGTPCLDDMEKRLFGNTVYKRPPIQGCRVDHSYLGKEGLEMARQAASEGDPYELAFVDFRLPGEWNGLATAGALLTADPHIQVVVMTAYSDLSWGDMVQTPGDAENLSILKKPFGRVEVIHLTTTLVQRRKRIRELETRVAHLEETLSRKNREIEIAAETAGRNAVNHLLYRIRIRLDSRCGIRSWSSDAARLFTYSVKEVLGKEVGFLLADSQRKFWKEDVVPLLKERGRLEIDLRMRKKSGELFSAWIFLSALQGKSGAVSGVFLYLAPGQKESERPGLHLVNARLEMKVLELAKELRRSRARIAGSGSFDHGLVDRMVHKLRSPIHGILGGLEMAFRDLPEEILEMKWKYHENIKENVKRLTGGMDKFLYLVLADVGKMRFCALPVRMQGLIVSLTEELKSRKMFEKKELIVENPTISTRASADSVRIFEALKLILQNAARFSEPGGKIEIRFREGEIETDAFMAPALRIDIIDEGRGIPEQELESVFNRFYTLGDTGYKKGSGLGLAVCRMIMGKHGGKIWAGHNPLGKGARISLLIPLYSVPLFEGAFEYKAVNYKPRY